MRQEADHFRHALESSSKTSPISWKSLARRTDEETIQMRTNDIPWYTQLKSQNCAGLLNIVTAYLILLQLALCNSCTYLLIRTYSCTYLLIRYTFIPFPVVSQLCFHISCHPLTSCQSQHY